MTDMESNGGGSDLESAVMYQCKKCPNKFFTAAEKDIHRQWHRNQRNIADGGPPPPPDPNRSRNSADVRRNSNKPGPKSRTKRAPSPPHSTVTLFNEVDQSRSVADGGKDDDDDGGSEGGGSKENDEVAKKKRRSNKKIKPAQVVTKNNGG